MSKETKNDEVKFTYLGNVNNPDITYEEHSLLTLEGQRYQCYIDNTHEVFPKTFEEWLRS
jgi:hypothetical protein